MQIRNISKEEWFPVVDENGIEVSRALRSVCHDGKSKLLHPVVHMHLFNSKGELFLQKRASSKDLLPGFWDTSVGGHISPGESTEDALKREAIEELGISDFTFRFIKKYIWESIRERELVWSFQGFSDVTPVINPEEIEEGRFWSLDEVKEKLDGNIFTPNFEHEFRTIVLTL